jgi:hypothetical protein
VPEPFSNAQKDVLLKYLMDVNANVFVFVDELDQLYKTPNDVNLTTLHDLACLGNQPTGRVSVVLCGSSAMMEDLITAIGVRNVKIADEFPLVKGAPSLNETKYLTRRVYSTLPTDLSAVAVISGTELNNANKPWLRLVAFVGGCTARAVRRTLQDSILSGWSPDSTLSGHNTLIKEDINQLRRKIIKGLYKKNIAIFKQFFDSNGFAVLHKIAMVPWEERFQPLLFAEIRVIWAKLISRKKVLEEDGGYLVYNLMHLSDRCWLTFDGVVDNHPERIYPYSMFHLFQEHTGEDAISAASEQLAIHIRKGARDLGVYLSNPRLTGLAGLSCVVM